MAPEGTGESMEPTRTPVNTDLVGGALGLGLAALFWFTREQWSFWSAVFPNLTLAVLAVLSAGLLVKGFTKPERLPFMAEGNRVRIVVTAALLLLWAISLRHVGTLLSSGVVFYALTIYLASAHQRVTIKDAVSWLALVVLEIGFLYLVFSRLLGVQLPRGILF